MLNSNLEKQEVKDNLGELINDFIFSLYNRSGNTRKTYARLLSHFMEYSANRIITLELLEQFAISLKTKYRQSTVNLYVKALKSFWRYLETRGYKNIGNHLQITPALPPEQRILSKTEYDSVCVLPKTNELDCFVFLCNTGLRVSEFISLRGENVSNGFLRIIGKGRKNRSIPINQTCKEILSRHPSFDFIRCRNEQWIYRLCQSLSQQAGIPKFHPHSCRHYFANELYHRGTPMSTVSRLLGHSCTMVTENVYVHWSEESLAGSTDLLENKPVTRRNVD